MMVSGSAQPDACMVITQLVRIDILDGALYILYQWRDKIQRRNGLVKLYASGCAKMDSEMFGPP